MMLTFRADLHVHTVLSPCAEVEMIPPLIVDAALEKGLHLIAITDHNASANVQAVMQAAKGTDLWVLPGMELQTREDVHLLCLFDNLQQLQSWQTVVDSLLPDQPNNIDFFGEQFIVDAEGDFIRREERLLLNSVNISLENAAHKVTQLGGLAIPAHVNRKAFGLIEILGLVPDYFEALEISRHIDPQTARQKYPQLGSHALIQNGDAHMLDGFLCTTEFEVQSISIDEIHQAILGQNGRKMIVR